MSASSSSHRDITVLYLRWRQLEATGSLLGPLFVPLLLHSSAIGLVSSSFSPWVSCFTYMLALDSPPTLATLMGLALRLESDHFDSIITTRKIILTTYNMLYRSPQAATLCRVYPRRIVLRYTFMSQTRHSDSQSGSPTLALEDEPSWKTPCIHRPFRVCIVAKTSSVVQVPSASCHAPSQPLSWPFYSGITLITGTNPPKVIRELL